MAFCKNCGAAMGDDEKFCASCGNSTAGAETNATNQNTYQNTNQNYNSGENGKFFNPADVEKGKPIAVLMYFIAILFILPLVADDYKTPYCRFHANQVVVLWLSSIAVSILFSIGTALIFTIIIPIICYIAGVVASIALFVFFIMGIVSAVKGENKPLPIIGGIKIIK